MFIGWVVSNGIERRVKMLGWGHRRHQILEEAPELRCGVWTWMSSQFVLWLQRWIKFSQKLQFTPCHGERHRLKVLGRGG